MLKITVKTSLKLSKVSILRKDCCHAKNQFKNAFLAKSSKNCQDEVLVAIGGAGVDSLADAYWDAAPSAQSGCGTLLGKTTASSRRSRHTKRQNSGAQLREGEQTAQVNSQVHSSSGEVRELLLCSLLRDAQGEEANENDDQMVLLLLALSGCSRVLFGRLKTM